MIRLTDIDTKHCLKKELDTFMTSEPVASLLLYFLMFLSCENNRIKEYILRFLYKEFKISGHQFYGA